MKNRGAVYVILASLLLGGSAYLATDAWYVGVGVGIPSALGGFLYVLPCVAEFSSKSRKRHECYLFIHGYLIALSVSNSLEKAFESGSQSMGEEFHRLDETLSPMQGREKAEYLSSYFESDLYAMFLSILTLYLDRGGDVLRLSSELTAEASRIEETEQSYQKKAARKGVSFFFLWLISIVIMVFLRFGLQSFFTTLRHSVPYMVSVAIFYLFFLFSVAFYVGAHTGCKPAWIKRKEKSHGTA